VIVLVAVVMLFVVGAMAALSIDVVTIYTARSEAQLAADAAALAAARVLANSGATSDPTGTLMTLAQTPAQNVAIQVAQQNQVGGTNLTTGNSVVSVVFNTTLPTNPTVTVSVQVTLPTFFARIWGSKVITVGASATAEAYNPSGANGKPPVAPMCVKPWLLPNMDPRDISGATTIFTPTTGAITPPSTAFPNPLLGWSSTTPSTPMPMSMATSTTTPWQFYPGDPSSFPAPTTVPACAATWTVAYRLAIAGCVRTPISCNSTVKTFVPGGSPDTEDAVNCLTHATNNGGDTVTVTPAYPPLASPFQFVAGADNPITGLAPNIVMVSDSLVTVPVFDSRSPTAPGSTVTIIGFVQLFLNPDGAPAPPPLSSSPDSVNTTVINLAGCGTGASGNPILGNGASPVAVRLISPP
jgi:hypothetical protein